MLLDNGPCFLPLLHNALEPALLELAYIVMPLEIRCVVGMEPTLSTEPPQHVKAAREVPTAMGMPAHALPAHRVPTPMALCPAPPVQQTPAPQQVPAHVLPIQDTTSTPQEP